MGSHTAGPPKHGPGRADTGNSQLSIRCPSSCAWARLRLRALFPARGVQLMGRLWPSSAALRWMESGVRPKRLMGHASRCRPVMIMDLLEAMARTGVFAVTLVLFPFTIVAYRRVRTPRMFLVAVAFGLFLFSGAVLFSEVLSDDINRMVSPGMDYGLFFIALTVLAVALVRSGAASRDS